jgi:hypothetical protein
MPLPLIGRFACETEPEEVATFVGSVVCWR